MSGALDQGDLRLFRTAALLAVLATRYVSWPPEVEFPAAASLAVVVSFGIGALLARLPGVSRII